MTNLSPNDRLEVFNNATNTICEASVSNAISKVLQAGANISIVTNTDGTITITPTFVGLTTIYVDGTTVAGAGTSGSPLHMVGLPTNIRITPVVLPPPTYNAPYSEQLGAVGGNGGVTYTAQSTSLPPGLTLSAGGFLSGTPASAGTYNFIVTATDSVGSVGKHIYTLTVASVPLTLSPSLFPNALIGTAYSQTISATGGSAIGRVFSIATGTLPVGLSLSGNTIAGMPTAVGSTYFMVSVTDSSGNTGSRYYTLGVESAVGLYPSSLSNGAVNSTYAQQITATGGTNSGFVFAVTAGALPTGLTLSSSGVLQGFPVAMGAYSFTITATDSGGNPASAVYSITISNALSLTPGTLGNASVSKSYSQAISAAGGSGSGYIVRLASGYLPSGLTLTNGAITGAPTESGTFSFGIKVTDSNGSTLTQNYSIVVATVALTLSALSAATGTVGVQFSNAIYATGGTGNYTSYWLSAGSLPPGLSLAGSTLSGSPTTAGNFAFSISVVDSAGDVGVQAYSINVSNAYVTMTAKYVFDGSTSPVVSIANNRFVGGGAPLPGWGQGTSGYFYAIVNGGVGPYTYAMRNDGYSNAVATVDATGLVTFVNASASQQLSDGFDGVVVVVTDSTGAQLSTTYYFTAQS